MTVGSDLAAARQAAGLSLEEVADKSRIRRSVLAAVERDDFSLCGGDAYARGHLRTLARIVGTDGDALVASYDREVARPEPALLPSEKIDLVGGLDRRRWSLNWSAVLAASLVVVLVYTVGVVLRGGSGGGSPAAAPLTSTPAVATSSASSAPRPSARRTATPAPVAQAPRSGVSVIVAASGGASWLRATTAAGATLFEGMVAKGGSKQFTDRKGVRLVIGNAGAVALTVNGKQVGAPGAKGQVANVSFGPQDPA
ncbi:uncharacterized protein DUF4115 [Motilibacter rhizosphaerae]|uniref:Uncharacterized protein DUF4115 n=1 Tax=Motilibacter rhizosphaerae TaxID=598652 RepID=A0A4Q7NPC2_9ACTN|nr:helix-turn-helix domain-containing protein [Motilibacter rhizosphaerae]RZS86932.1 uncharacterized protein DUF4115 [Motilibacter rhizosphaerae]